MILCNQIGVIMKHNMKHYDQADIANIKLLIMSEDSSNVYIGVKLAKNVLEMSAEELKKLITIEDCKISLDKKGNYQGIELKAFGRTFYGNTNYGAYNKYRERIKSYIYKLIYDLD